MDGKNTLWQPGMDHAGIATQTVVERQQQREGKTRHDLGRAAFIDRVWKWKAESGGRIQMQQRVMGVSADWKRSKFTMDEDMSVAVTEAFVRLYEQGLIYRATRLINWCPECQTALSDLEVDNEEGANGELFEFAYKVSGTGEEIIVATTRPETILGDTAVAVHPDDPRYAHLHGKFLDHPFVDRRIPIITDAILVDPKFGTGAVKVTPAHDFNDFATGKRHNLPEINIFNLDVTVNENGGEAFKGLERKRARTAVKKARDDKGLVRGTKPHILTLPKCQRSGGVVEPMISTQWFCKMAEMAASPPVDVCPMLKIGREVPRWLGLDPGFNGSIGCPSRPKVPLAQLFASSLLAGRGLLLPTRPALRTSKAKIGPSRPFRGNSKGNSRKRDVRHHPRRPMLIAKRRWIDYAPPVPARRFTRLRA